MASALDRRLSRIEAAIMPQPETPWVRLLEPGKDATAAEREKYAADLAGAKAAGANIFIRRIIYPPSREIEEDGARVFGDEVEMGLAILAAQPSKEGKRNLLEDVIRGLPGNVMGVVSRQL